MTKEVRNPNDEKGRLEKPVSGFNSPYPFVIRHSSFAIFSRQWSVAFALLLLLLVLAVLAPGFFQKSQLFSIVSSAVPVLFTACGVTLVIISRQIDISIGSQFALCSIFLGLLINAHWPMPVAAVATIFAGACFGAFNGALVAGLGLPS